MKTKNPAANTLIDAAILCSPLLILAVALLGEAMQSEIWKKPEWSFITLLLFVEAFRDIAVRGMNTNATMEDIGNAYAFYALILAVLALVLFFDFRHSLDHGPLPTNVIYFLKFSCFGAGLVYFAWTRYQRHNEKGSSKRSRE